MIKSHKLLTLAQLTAQVKRLRALGLRIVFTNGCFDLLHAGHIRYLQRARELGDILIVALNSDTSTAQLKGEGRPVQGEMDRAEILAALEPVDFVVIFRHLRCTEVIKQVQPDVYAKGGDYRIDTLDASEREALEDCGVEIKFIAIHDDISTTGLIDQIQAINNV